MKVAADKVEGSAALQRSHLPACAALLAASGVTLLSLVLYVLTAAPDIPLVDSGELALAAYSGGVAHPPGFPLYLILGWLFSHLPFFSSPVRGLNLMSALFAALSAGMCFLIVERSIAVLQLSRGVDTPDSGERRAAALLSAGAGALAWATARNPWSWSGVTEVYSLNIFLISAAWFCTLVWACAEVSNSGPRSVRSGRWLVAAAAFSGLGLANHHATSALLFPSLLLILLALKSSALRDRRVLFGCAVVLVASLGLYLYLPIAARNDPALGWGGVDSASRLIRHVVGWQYRTFASPSSFLTPLILRDFGSTLLLDCGLLASVLALAGLGLAPGLRTVAERQRKKSTRQKSGRTQRRKRSVSGGHHSKGVLSSAGLISFGVPVSLIVLNLALVVGYTAGPEDQRSYELPAHLAWCVLAGLGLWLIGRRWPGLRRPAFLVPTVVLLGSANLFRNFDYCNLSSEYSGRTFVREALDEVPPGSIVFTTEWNFYAPYLYMHHVEGYRPDIAVVNVLLMRRFWYASYLERSFPDYVEPARTEFEVFRDQVIAFDQGSPYDADEIANAYASLLTRWAGIGRARARAFIDFGSVGRSEERDWIGRFNPVPDGLLLALEGAAHDGGTARPIAPKDAENLRYLRARVGEGNAVLRDPLRIDPTSIRYFKVYDQYRKAVEASLLLVALTRSEDEMRERAAEYGTWFPDVPFVMQNLEEKLRKAPEVTRPRS